MAMGLVVEVVAMEEAGVGGLLIVMIVIMEAGAEARLEAVMEVPRGSELDTERTGVEHG